MSQWGLHSTEVAFLLRAKQSRVRFSAFPKNNFDVNETYQRRWLEESGQRLEYVDQTHLVLASGKLVFQKVCHQPAQTYPMHELTVKKQGLEKYWCGWLQLEFQRCQLP